MTSSWPRSKPSWASRFVRLSADQVSAPNRQDRQAHVGMHAQRQPGKVWAGVVLPVGKMTSEQMRGLAEIARELGDGDIRLTVWQNLLISGIAEENAALVETCLKEIGLTSKRHQHPRRADRVHRQYRVQVCLVQHQGHGGGHRRMGGVAGRTRQPDQHPPHRLPTFLRPALHRRHRHDRLPRAHRCIRRGHGRRLPRVRRRRLRPRRRHRPRALSRRQGRGLPAPCRALAAGLSRPSSGRRDLPDVRTPPGCRARSRPWSRASPRRPPHDAFKRRSHRLQPVNDPREAPFSRRAAGLAQRLLCRPAVARCNAGRNACERPCQEPPPMRSPARMTARRGMTPPCRSTSACSWPTASRCRAGCSRRWRSRTAANAAICARPIPRPSPRARRPSSTCACPAARRRAAC